MNEGKQNDESSPEAPVPGAFSPQAFISKNSAIRPFDIWATFVLNLLSGAGYLVFAGMDNALGVTAVTLQMTGELVRLAVIALSPAAKRWAWQGRYNIFVTYPSALFSLIALGYIFLPNSVFYLTVITAALFSVYNQLVLKSRFLSFVLAAALTASVALDFLAGIRGFELYAHLVVYVASMALYARLQKILTEYQMGILHQAESLRYLSLQDRVTGLPNRDLFNERLKYLSSLAKRKAAAFSLILFDLDNFSSHNDKLGAEGADEILVQLATRVKNALRSSDILSRWSGDRFYLLTGDLDDEDPALKMVEKIRQSLKEPFHVGGKEVLVTVSFGVASFPQDAADEKGLVVAGEKALRLAKQKKPMGLSLFDGAMEKTMRDRMAMQSALQGALPGGEFILHFQPKFTRERVLDSMEILLRWKSAQYGMVSPVVFIPLLEQSGLIRDVGDWIFREAARQMFEWQGIGKTLVPLAINVSVQQCLDPAFGKRTMDFVAGTGLPTHLFEVELTESLFSEKSDTLMKVLTDFRTIGMHCAVDDFGTGYSSLVRLAELPIDVIKIDKAFVDKIGQNRDTETVIHLILQMAHAMGRRTVAEGVEHLAQVDFLADRGCPLFQGYYFSKPLPAREAGLLLSPSQVL